MALALTLWCPFDWEAVQEPSVRGDFRLPALERLLARSDRYPSSPASYYEAASYLFHQPSTLPPAALTAASDLTHYDEDAFWLRADPVQMIPDRDTLVLFPPQALQITPQESHALIASFNTHFEQDGVCLESSHPARWYIRIAQSVDLQTTPLDAVAYRSLKDAMPKGNAASYWRQLLNEVQMLFFSHPVNEARREKGWPEINSLWLWGEGVFSSAQSRARPTSFIGSEHPYLKGMAKLTQARQYTSPKNYQAWWNLYSDSVPRLDEHHSTQLFHHLIELDCRIPISAETQENELELTGDAVSHEQIESVWSALEANWLSPIEAALKAKHLHSVLLDFGFGYRFYLEPPHLKRFWRRRKSVQKWRSLHQLS